MRERKPIDRVLRRCLEAAAARRIGQGFGGRLDVLVNNAADPGYTATDLNGHSGPRTVEEGARIAVHLATLPSDGPTGGFFNDDGKVPW